ncbi:uracil-DNA glycosylase [Microbulbifer hydrolyticus]|uniref:Uracil-DNA glycosylase n=1 Tax=Microbulbifer hydrolyticus TaxID=48074 RepID=A0A6P1TCW0_9GAMM|nr:uracil-DNA glycosylase [Microbulbifer hydrolyticus]MBB5209979.1 uracil-DNA glycosylase [Microbulbifer hydrolyticus]QHQ39493.1 uracil-DNA glycosylase [Microbulbifer hydrolyticus]
MQASLPMKIHPSWYSVLEPEFNKRYMSELREFLQQEKQSGKNIFPPGGQIFNAFNSTPFDQVKVVVLGQDPYHGAGQAHGLCFSVMPGVRIPPSLKNIYKELYSDLGIAPPDHGCLQPWAEQGVLLLNATLTVEESKAGAHQGRGWEQFTDAAIHALAEQRQGLVFILWGSYAQKKGGFIDSRKHLVLRGPHPSPLSAHRGFFGTRPFSQANAYLQERGEAPINWALPPSGELRRVAVEV